ncbi:hypothetical protein RRG08_066233 [Elysia crispata]|uniref:Uncharacterized protein n=1 Tax=Elysia crispata TaxID=231223 RepID=A0AAE1BFD0_9GAST|nr:hypothetical protein RRG08_066233 [Elysia crispata]
MRGSNCNRHGPYVWKPMPPPPTHCDTAKLNFVGRVSPWVSEAEYDYPLLVVTRSGLASPSTPSAKALCIVSYRDGLASASTGPGTGQGRAATHSVLQESREYRQHSGLIPHISTCPWSERPLEWRLSAMAALIPGRPSHYPLLVLPGFVNSVA